MCCQRRWLLYSEKQAIWGDGGLMNISVSTTIYVALHLPSTATRVKSGAVADANLQHPWNKLRGKSRNETLLVLGKLAEQVSRWLDIFRSCFYKPGFLCPLKSRKALKSLWWLLLWIAENSANICIYMIFPPCLTDQFFRAIWGAVFPGCSPLVLPQIKITCNLHTSFFVVNLTPTPKILLNHDNFNGKQSQLIIKAGGQILHHFSIASWEAILFSICLTVIGCSLAHVVHLKIY